MSTQIDPILTAVRQALVLCRQVQHNAFSTADKVGPDKKDKEPVTIADYGSQAIIGRALQAHFPDDAVIAEEAGDQFLQLTTPDQRAQIMNLLTTLLDVNVSEENIVSWLDHGAGQESSRTWVIDPIDGTKGFINMRHYAVGVGILTDGQPTGGILGAPGYGDGISGDDDDGVMFFVQDGKAYMQPIAGGEPQVITVSERETDVRFVQSFEKQHASKSRMSIVREKAGFPDANVRELDSMEKYALVANGDADVYMRLPNLDNKRPHMSWDHAPGVALVIAAGGKATDVDGSPLIFSEGRIMPNKGFLISNGVLHDQLIEATQSLLQEEAAE